MEWGGLEANWPKMGEALNSVCASMDANAATQLQQRITNSLEDNWNDISNEGFAAPEIVKQGIQRTGAGGIGWHRCHEHGCGTNCLELLFLGLIFDEAFSIFVNSTR